MANGQRPRDGIADRRIQARHYHSGYHNAELNGIGAARANLEDIARYGSFASHRATLFRSELIRDILKEVGIRVIVGAVLGYDVNQASKNARAFAPSTRLRTASMIRKPTRSFRP